MSGVKRISFVVVLLIWSIVKVQPVCRADELQIPDTITIGYLQDLYEDVVFDHQTHLEMYDCSSCHHHTLGTGTENENCQKCHVNSCSSKDKSCSACHRDRVLPILPDSSDALAGNVYHIDKPGLKGALHLQCLGCHRVESGPTDCQDCHIFTEKGRERFSLRN